MHYVYIIIIYYLLKKTDGSFCSTSEENAEVFHQHFQQLYKEEANFDPTVLDSLPQHNIVEGHGHIPTDESCHRSFTKLNTFFSFL